MNEREPQLQRDMVTWLKRLVPRDGDWLHNLDTVDDRDNAHSHLLGLFMNASETIPVADGEMILGDWQSIFFSNSTARGTAGARAADHGRRLIMTPDDMAGFYAQRRISMRTTTSSSTSTSNALATRTRPLRICAASNPPRNGGALASTKTSSPLRREGAGFGLRTTSFRFSIPVKSPVRAGACVRITIMHPHGNFGPRIPNLLSAVCGEGIFFSPAFR